MGWVLEIGDSADSGDEFGALVLFVVVIIMLIWQYMAASRLAPQTQDAVQVQEKVGTR